MALTNTQPPHHHLRHQEHQPKTKTTPTTPTSLAPAPLSLLLLPSPPPLLLLPLPPQTSRRSSPPSRCRTAPWRSSTRTPTTPPTPSATPTSWASSTSPTSTRSAAVCVSSPPSVPALAIARCFGVCGLSLWLVCWGSLVWLGSVESVLLVGPWVVWDGLDWVARLSAVPSEAIERCYT